MPITTALPAGATPSMTPTGMPGTTGASGATGTGAAGSPGPDTGPARPGSPGATGATTFGDAMREVEATRAAANGPTNTSVNAPTSAKVVVTQLEDAKVAERIDTLVDTASAVRSPSARERLLSALSDLGTQYEELLADVEGMDGARANAANPHPGVERSGDTSPHRIAAEPSSSAGASSFDADAQFADWRSEQKDLLTLQIRAHRLMHSVEVVSKTVEQSVSGMKTVFQTQV